MLADRFGGGPFIYMEADTIDYERALILLGIEAEVARVYATYEKGDRMYGYGPDGYPDDPRISGG